jgi:hypothetical protein
MRRAQKTAKPGLGVKTSRPFLKSSTCRPSKGPGFRRLTAPELPWSLNTAGGRVQFVRSGTWYQIATNFVMSNVGEGPYPCWRYRTADKILSEAKELSYDLIRDVLEKTHQEGGGLTVYSNIYDLKKGLIYLYYLRNFKEVVALNLAEELKKEERRLDLPALFHSQGGE